MRNSTKEFRGDPELAARLPEFRKRIGFTQEDLALAIGMTQQNISSWQREKSTPTIESYVKLIAIAKDRGAEQDRRFFLSKVRQLLLEKGIYIRELEPDWDRRTERRAARQTRGADDKQRNKKGGKRLARGRPGGKTNLP